MISDLDTDLRLINVLETIKDKIQNINIEDKKNILNFLINYIDIENIFIEEKDIIYKDLIEYIFIGWYIKTYLSKNEC